MVGMYWYNIYLQEIMKVQFNLEGNALRFVQAEQLKRDEEGRITGKGRLINILLSELYERRLKDTIVAPTPVTNKKWKKLLKAK